MTRSNLILGFACLAALTVVGCNGGGGNTTANNSSPNTQKQITLGFSQVGAESGWRLDNTNSIKQAAQDAGIKLDFDDARQQQANQIKAIRAFIAEGVDVIALSPGVTTGWVPVFQEAKRAHIPIILSDRTADVPDDLFVTFIGSDFVKEGTMAGDWLAKRTGGKAVIAEITGTPGSAPANDRQKGFDDVIAKNPGMKIIFRQTGNFTRSEGKQVMEALLKSAIANQITAVFCHNDDMALGAIQAMEEAGKKPGKDITIVSIDGIKPIFQAMVAGKTNCTVECNPLLGPLIMQAAKDIVAGKALPKRTVMTDRLFDDTDAAKELPNRKY